uniref:Endonuclease/exonuclease/phosphatase family domain-containing protein 1-like n=1 Tax=Callorhinchus milii TaxID=7868 RepID=A0A4W3GCS9_CALMI
MGGTLGCHRSIPRDPLESGRRRKFSAACNFSNVSVRPPERLNINAATEEELMTLPGVGRAVSRNIVDYRQRIGGFKKVEDLALVSGVGAARLEHIKPEICVSGGGGSAQHSPGSPPRGDPAEAAPLDVATATETANGRRGPSRTAADAVVVVVGSPVPTPSAAHTNGGLHFSPGPGPGPHPSPTSLSLHSEDLDLDLDLPPGGPAQVVAARPSVEALGSWNLQRCSAEKANNPGVREVVCMSLLESG